MQRVLITGGAKRLGRLLADCVVKTGAAVALHVRAVSEDARTAVREIEARGGQAVALGADLNDLSAVRGLVDEAARRLGGPLTGLINNASVFTYDAPDAVESAVFDEAMRVNVKAPVMLAEAFFNQAAPDANNCVVNLLDQKLWNPNPDFFSYSLTKYALLGATDLMALAFAPRVRVAAVAPGIIFPSHDQTAGEFEAAAPRNLLKKPIDPQEVGRAVVYLLESESLTGQVLHVDNGQRFAAAARDVMFAVRGGKDSA